MIVCNKTLYSSSSIILPELLLQLLLPPLPQVGQVDDVLHPVGGGSLVHGAPYKVVGLGYYLQRWKEYVCPHLHNIHLVSQVLDSSFLPIGTLNLVTHSSLMRETTGHQVTELILILHFKFWKKAIWENKSNKLGLSCLKPS